MRRLRADAAACAVFGLLTLWVTGRLLRDPAGRMPDGGRGGNEDQRLLEWNLAYVARAVRHLENPFFTAAQNAPDGVNLMANISLVGLGAPLAPLTWWAGPAVTYNAIIVLSLFGTAVAWYVVLSRYLVRSRLAAAVGAGLCGFSPGMVAHARGHHHMIAQFLIPVILALALRLRELGRLVPGAMLLGALAAWQVLIGEEMLFFFALGAGVFVVAYALQRRDVARESARRFLAGLLIAAATAGVLVAYPLWLQFAGPQSYHGVPGTARIGMDLASYAVPPQLAIVGSREWTTGLALNAAEENTFFAVPLLAAALAVLIWRRRDPVVRSVAISAAVFGILSLGPELVIFRHRTGVPLPWRALMELPLFDSAVAARFGLVVAAALGVLVALGLDAALARLRERPDPRFGWALAAAVALALIPLLPRPLPAIAVAPRPVPDFVTSGEWRGYVRDGRTLAPVPIPGSRDASGLRWPASVDVAFAVPGGYFIGPGPDGRGRFGPLPRPTSTLLNQVAATGTVPPITEADRINARADLAHWRTDAVVLGRHRHEEALRATLEALLGPARRVSDVWLWDLRPEGQPQ